MKKAVPIIIVILVAATVLFYVIFSAAENDADYRDTVTYDGKTYELLEYNADIFTYSLNSNKYMEVDEIYPILSKKWDAVYFNGDIFVEQSQVKRATEYYADDDNYNWFVTIGMDDREITNPVSVTKKELEFLYNMENAKRQKTIVFDDIKHFASIIKESKDGFVFALTTIVNCDNSWYWKTEVMTDDDREYVIPLPESLCEKLSRLM